VCTAKETINKANRQPTGWQKIFVQYTFDKLFVSKTYKELKKLNNKKTAQFKNVYFSNEDVWTS
jgi:hypothetical protein